MELNKRTLLAIPFGPAWVLISVGRNNLLHMRWGSKRRRHTVQPIGVVIHVIVLRSRR